MAYDISNVFIAGGACQVECPTEVTITIYHITVFL
jgi:hypothetical protein